jgi:hypothetical protein
MHSKFALYVLFVLINCILLGSGDGGDFTSIDVARVTVDSEAPLIVHSLHFGYNHPVTIVIGHSKYIIPFENISELEIDKKSDGFYARVKNISGNEIQGKLDYYWGLVGTTEQAGLKGDFNLEGYNINKKVLAIRTNVDSPPPIREGAIIYPEREPAVFKDKGNNNIINKITTFINNSGNVITNNITNNNVFLEIVLFSLLSFAVLKIVLDILEKRKK